ncbi:Trk system potassium transporter TrkA [Jeotgalibaca sp. MA1X17-3]|uniref:Trk system potassium transporter TrkA n=1 Tax=Jeotgalibaca sp. MA1X17-3 TaxID=2908211 RepID=UPI001F34AC60|nr:Trk system potassium transporter TrkA [Jeotgalibaca sp. MA1X17-3]UJF16343.1 Trk system potassium transporter TrkA [Jeotgalibaca sp. MA1X17-3]
MKIVIAGGGKVGSVLCTELSSETNDIILIEKNPKKLDDLISKNDISGIAGNGASYDIQVEAGVKTCDIFIAVTPQDEVNIMAAILAKKLGAKYTIARVRNPEYSYHLDFVRESLGINLMINPELEAARNMVSIIKFPTILSLQSFARNKVDLIEIEVAPNSGLENQSLSNFRTIYGDILVCAIKRGDDTIIPSGTNTLQRGDHIYVLGNKRVIRKFYKKVSPDKSNIQSVLIIGGGRITYYLIDLLKGHKMDIKVIERRLDVAENLSDVFPEVEVILGDGTDQEVLESEGIENYQAFLSLTGVDEENIITSMFASQKKVKKVITKVNRELLLKIFNTLGMESIITPKRVIANIILRFVRSLSASSVSDVEALYRIADNQAEAIQFKIKKNSKATDIPLEKLETKPNLLIGYIVRDQKLIFPGGQDVVKENDRVIVITKDKTISSIDDILK